MDTFQRLNEMKLFDIVPDTDLNRWVGKFRRERHSRGMVIVRQNERATAFYIVDAGELRAQTWIEGGELPCAYFYPGDYFGETGLLTGEPRNATIRVLTDAELLVLDKLDFDQLMEEFPEVRDRLFTIGRQREQAGRTRFPWERPDEVTMFFSIKHWVAYLRKLPLTLVVGGLGILASALYLRLPVAEPSLLISFALMLIGGTFLGLSVFLLIYHFLDWRNDHYIITNLRILHIERVLLLREDRDEAPIERVQDVQVKQKGILANVLNYGDVVIQTAAATQQVVFATVPNPDYARSAVFESRQRTRTQERAEAREAIRQELGRRLDVPVVPLEDQVEATEKAPAAPAEKKEEKKAIVSVEFLSLLRHVGRWVLDLITFETWIYSDGGKTITWRKNGWLLLRASLLPLFSAIFVVGLALLLFARDIGSPTVKLFPLLLLLPIIVWWSYVYWDWQNDIYQITGNRLIDLKKRPLFLEEIRRETTLDRVENISLSIPGPIAQLLNYGTVVIETAGEIGAFNFVYVHDPRGVQREIFDRMESYKQQQREAEERRQREEMYDFFEVYDELLKRKQEMTPPGSDRG